MAVRPRFEILLRDIPTSVKKLKRRLRDLEEGLVRRCCPDCRRCNQEAKRTASDADDDAASRVVRAYGTLNVAPGRSRDERQIGKANINASFQ